MTRKFLLLTIVLYLVAFLAGCGKNVGVQCSWSVENSVLLSVGPNEKAKCPNPDDFISSYVPIYKPGGEVIAIDVQCQRRVQTCKAVNQ